MLGHCRGGGACGQACIHSQVQGRASWARHEWSLSSPSAPAPALGLQVPSIYQVQSLNAKNAWGAPRAYSFAISYTTSQLLPGEAACVHVWHGGHGAA